MSKQATTKLKAIVQQATTKLPKDAWQWHHKRKKIANKQQIAKSSRSK